MSAFDELVDHPGVGRVFERPIVPGLAEAAPGGRVRLDALACWLQDIAFADVVDAGLGEVALWVVRRTRIAVRRFPRLGEPAVARTWCSGIGRMWAQRRTTITSAGGGAVEAVALWVHLDPVSARPLPITEGELEIYGPPAAGREIKARLRHPSVVPEAPEATRDWTFRRTDLDVADHINNAAYWCTLEEELLAAGAPEPESLDVEIEHRTPAQAGPHAIVVDGPRRWIAAPGGEVHASFLLSDA